MPIHSITVKMEPLRLAENKRTAGHVKNIGADMLPQDRQVE